MSMRKLLLVFAWVCVSGGGCCSTKPRRCEKCCHAPLEDKNKTSSVEAYIQGALFPTSEDQYVFVDFTVVNGVGFPLPRNYSTSVPVKIALEYPSSMNPPSRDFQAQMCVFDTAVDSEPCLFLVAPEPGETVEIDIDVEVVNNEEEIILETLNVSSGWVYLWGKWPTKVKAGLVTVKAKGTTGIIESYGCSETHPCKRVYLLSGGDIATDKGLDVDYSTGMHPMRTNERYYPVSSTGGGTEEPIPTIGHPAEVVAKARRLARLCGIPQ